MIDFSGNEKDKVKQIWNLQCLDLSEQGLKKRNVTHPRDPRCKEHLQKALAYAEKVSSILYKIKLVTNATNLCDESLPYETRLQPLDLQQYSTVKPSDIPHPFDPRRKKILGNNPLEVIDLDNGDRFDDLKASVKSALWFRLDVDFRRWPNDKNFSINYHNEQHETRGEKEDYSIVSRLQPEINNECLNTSDYVNVAVADINFGFLNGEISDLIALFNKKRKGRKCLKKSSDRTKRNLRTIVAANGRTFLRSFMEDLGLRGGNFMWNNFKFSKLTMTRYFPSVTSDQDVETNETFWSNRNTPWGNLPIIGHSCKVVERDEKSDIRDQLEPLYVSDIANPQKNRPESEVSETPILVAGSLTPIDWNPQLLSVFPLHKNHSPPSGQKKLSMTEKSPRRTPRHSATSGDNVTAMETQEKNHAEKENLETKNNSPSQKKKYTSHRRRSEPPSTPLAKPKVSCKRRYSMCSSSKNSSNKSLSSKSSKHQDSHNKKSASRVLFKATTTLPRWKCESSLNKLVLKKDFSESNVNNFEKIDNDDAISCKERNDVHHRNKRIKFLDLIENSGKVREKNEIKADVKTQNKLEVRQKNIEANENVERSREKIETTIRMKSKRGRKESSTFKKRIPTDKADKKKHISEKAVPHLDGVKQLPIIVRIETPKIKINWMSSSGKLKNTDFTSKPSETINGKEKKSFSKDEDSSIQDVSLKCPKIEMKPQLKTNTNTNTTLVTDDKLENNSEMKIDAAVTLGSKADVENELNIRVHDSKTVQSNVIKEQVNTIASDASSKPDQKKLTSSLEFKELQEPEQTEVNLNPEPILESQKNENIESSEKVTPVQSDVQDEIHNKLAELTSETEALINNLEPKIELSNIQKEVVTQSLEVHTTITEPKKCVKSKVKKKRKKIIANPVDEVTPKKQRLKGLFSSIFEQTDIKDQYDEFVSEKVTNMVKLIKGKPDTDLESTDSGFFTVDRVTPDSTESPICFTAIHHAPSLTDIVENLDDKLSRKTSTDCQKVNSSDQHTCELEKNSQRSVADNPKEPDTENHDSILPDSSTNFADDLEGDIEVLSMLSSMTKTKVESDDCASNGSSELEVLLYKSKADSASLPNYVDVSDRKSIVDVRDGKDELSYITLIKEVINVNNVKEENPKVDSANELSFNASGITDITTVQDISQLEAGIIKDSSKNIVSCCDIKSTIDLNNKFRHTVNCNKKNCVIDGAGTECTLSTNKSERIDVIDLSDDDENYKECQSNSYSNLDCEIILDTLPKIGLNDKLIHNILRRPKVELINIETDNAFGSGCLSTGKSNVSFSNNEAKDSKAGLLMNIESSRTSTICLDVTNKQDERLGRLKSVISSAQDIINTDRVVCEDVNTNENTLPDKVVAINPQNEENSALSCTSHSNPVSQSSETSGGPNDAKLVSNGRIPAQNEKVLKIALEQLNNKAVVDQLRVTTMRPAEEEEARESTVMESQPFTPELERVSGENERLVIEPESRRTEPEAGSIESVTGTDESASISITVDPQSKITKSTGATIPDSNNTHLTITVPKKNNMADLLQRLNINIVSIEDECKQEIVETTSDEYNNEESDWLTKLQGTTSEIPVEISPSQPKLRVRSLAELGGTRWHSPTELDYSSSCPSTDASRSGVVAPQATSHTNTPLLNHLLTKNSAPVHPSTHLELTNTSPNVNATRLESLPGTSLPYSPSSVTSAGSSQLPSAGSRPASRVGPVTSGFTTPAVTLGNNVNSVRSNRPSSAEIRSAHAARRIEGRARMTPQPEMYLQTPSAFTPVQSMSHAPFNFGQVMPSYQLNPEQTSYSPYTNTPHVRYSPSVSMEFAPYNMNPVFRSPISTQASASTTMQHGLPPPISEEDSTPHALYDVVASNILKFCGTVPNIRCASELYGNVISRAQTPNQASTPPIVTSEHSNFQAHSSQSKKLYVIKLLAYCVHNLQSSRLVEHIQALTAYSTITEETFRIQKYLTALVEYIVALLPLNQVNTREMFDKLVVDEINKFLVYKTSFQEINTFCNIWELMKRMNFLGKRLPSLKSQSADSQHGYLTKTQYVEMVRQVLSYGAIHKNHVNAIAQSSAKSLRLQSIRLADERSQPSGTTNSSSSTKDSSANKKIQSRVTGSEGNRAKAGPEQAEDNIRSEYKSCVMCKKQSTIGCAKCKLVPYCSTDCQRKHWKSKHHLECK